jgi:hypothetical protein
MFKLNTITIMLVVAIFSQAYAAEPDFSVSNIVSILNEAFMLKQNKMFLAKDDWNNKLSLSMNAREKENCYKSVSVALVKSVRIANQNIGNKISSFVVGDCSNDYENIISKLNTIYKNKDADKIRRELISSGQTELFKGLDIRVDMETLGEGYSAYHLPIFGFGHGFGVINTHALVDHKNKSVFMLQVNTMEYCNKNSDFICTNRREAALKALRKLLVKDRGLPALKAHNKPLKATPKNGAP